MNKRMTVVGTALVAASAACAAFGGEIPDWAEGEIQATYLRYQAWKGDDVTVAVPFVTDVHSYKAEIDESDGFADSKRHIRILRRAAEVFGADATADLGDTGLDCMDSSTTASTAAHQAARIASQQSLYADFTRPHLALVGNHDHGAATNRITNAQFGAFFNDASFARSGALVTSAARDYGYYDVPGKNARLFFLNTTEAVEGNGYGLTDGQVEFLRAHLAELKDGATAAVFTHFCLHQRLGRWDEPGWQPLTGRNLETTVGVLEAFAARTDVHLAGVVSGDSHYDNHICTNGVRWVISQGFGGSSQDHRHADPGKAVFTSFSRSSQTLVDVVAFKPATGEFRTFRIGAGGPDRDVDFNDTFTWTGAAGDGRWSTAGNWTTDSTTHDVPRSGDNVIAKVKDKCAVTNDIAGLRLPYLKLVYVKTGSTSTTYADFFGQEITLTGGMRALEVSEEGTGSGSHRLRNNIPFFLPAGTNRFVCTPGRLHQYGKISGPGALRIASKANYYSPSADNDYAGGTWFEGGHVDFSNNARDCMGAETGPVAIDGETYFRPYSGETIPYSFLLMNQDGRAVAGYNFRVERSLKFTGAIAGDAMNFLFPAANPLTLEGPVSLSGTLRFPVETANLTPPKVTVNGRLAVGSLNRGVDTSSSYVNNGVDIYLNAADNAIGNIYVGAQNHYAGAANAFGTNAVIRPGVLDDARGLFDCCGHDQTIDRFALNANYRVVADGAGHVVRSTGGKATLTLAATDDCETDVKFGDNLSLVWAPKAAGKTFATSADASRVMTMDGAIVVSNGTFAVNGANGFPNATAVDVAPGATFVWSSTRAKGLVGVKRLRLAAGARFEVAAGAAWPFAENGASLRVDLASDSTLGLRDGDRLTVGVLSVDGVDQAANRTFTHEDVPAIAGGEVLTGRVQPGEFTVKSYVGRGLVACWDAIDNAGTGAHDATATTWKDLSGNGHDLTLDQGVWQGGDALYAKGDDKDLAATLPDGATLDYQTVETVLENMRQNGNGIALFNGGSKYLVFAASRTQWENGKGTTALTYATATGRLALSYVYSTFLYQNGVRRAIESASDSWFGHGTGFHLGGRQQSGYGGYAFKGNYHAIRLYDRALDDEEVRWNQAVDAVRYRGASPLEFPEFENFKQEYGQVFFRGTFESDYGKVSLNGAAGVKCAADWFAGGEEIRLAASAPTANYRFLGWTGDTWLITKGSPADREITVRPTTAKFRLTAAFRAPTVTWTGRGDGVKWSDENNWQDEAGVARTPADGDAIEVAGLAGGTTYKNDLPVGLMCAGLHFGTNKSGSSARIDGNSITLTGGLAAFVNDSEDIRINTPFVIADETDSAYTKFTANKRFRHGAVISGDGDVCFHTASGVYIDLHCNNTYVGDTLVSGAGIVDAGGNGGTANNGTCFGPTSNKVLVESSGYFRIYVFPFPYDIEFSPSGTKNAWTKDYNLYDSVKSITGRTTGSHLAIYFDRNTATGAVDMQTTFSRDVIIDGPVTVAANAPARGSHFGLTFDGTFKAKSFNEGADETKIPTAGDNVRCNLDVRLRGAGNDVKSFDLRGVNLFGEAANAFGVGDAVLTLGACDARVGKIDLGGFTQTVDRFVSAAWVADTGANAFVGHEVTSAAGGRLVFAATADMTTDAHFGGDMSLVWAPLGDFAFATYATVGRVHPMTGALVVSNGTFTVNGTNSFPNVTALEVADGASFAWASSAAKGLRSLKRLVLGKTARVTLPADVATAYDEIWVDGNRLAGGKYSGTGCTEPGVTVLPQLEGLSTVLYARQGTGEPVAATWTGAVGTSLAAAGNWKDATVAPDHTAGTLVPTFADASAKGLLANVAEPVRWHGVVFDAPGDFTLDNAGGDVGLGSGGITLAGDRAYAINAPVSPFEDQVWNLGNGGGLEISALNDPAGHFRQNVLKRGDAPLLIGKGHANSDFSGNLTWSNGLVTVQGEMTSNEGELRIDTRASTAVPYLCLDGAVVRKPVVLTNGGGTMNPICFEPRTENALLGGLDLEGNTGISLDAGTRLTLSGKIRFRGYFYPQGDGATLVFTNVTLVDSQAVQPHGRGLTMSVEAPGLPIKSYFDVPAGDKLYTRCPNALGRAQVRLYDGSLWDLCGQDQTCGRFSWISTVKSPGVYSTLYTTQEIHSDEPATLTVAHDNRSGSGSNKGAQTWAGKITGRVSLVKTGGFAEMTDQTPDAQDLTIASEITSTGSVTVAWGLLSFTNAFACTINTTPASLPGGSWPNCTRATAGRTVDGKGNPRYGTLELLHSKALGRKTEVYIAKGAKVRLGRSARVRVAALYFENDAGEWVRQDDGVWGSGAVTTQYSDGDRFEGAGVLRVGQLGSAILVR